MRKYGVLHATLASLVALLAVTARVAVAADEATPVGYLGVYLEDESASSRGAYVEDVAPESPAEKAGIRKGDLITSWNGEKTANSHALIEKLVKAGAGESVTVRLSRDEWEKEVKLTLGKREGTKTPAKKTETPATPATGERGFLGCFLKANPEGSGAFVDGVVDGSPAAKANVKKGDVITGMDGQAVKEYTQLQELLRATKPGQKVTFRIAREGWERDVPIEMGRRAAEKAAPAPQARPTEPAPAPKPETKKPAFLGVSLVDNDGKGPLKVDDVMANSPAEKSGIKPGDVVVAIGEKKVTSIKDFEDALKAQHAGDKTVIRLERDGWAREVKVTFGERND